MLKSTIRPNMRFDHRNPSKERSGMFINTETHSIVCTCIMQLVVRTRAWVVILDFDNFHEGRLFTVNRYFCQSFMNLLIIQMLLFLLQVIFIV